MISMSNQPRMLACHLECSRGHRMPYVVTDKLIGRISWGEHAGTIWRLAKPCPWCGNEMVLMRGDRPETCSPIDLLHDDPAPPTKREAEPPDQPEYLALRIRMGHDINAERIMFKALPYRKGNALWQFEDDLAQIVKEEVADQTSAIEARLANLRGAAQPIVELLEVCYDWLGPSYPNQVELKRRAKALRAALAEATAAPPSQSAEPSAPPSQSAEPSEPAS